ncbi:MAG: 50S ribosomal protein L15 [Parcubacteria group bacterium]
MRSEGRPEGLSNLQNPGRTNRKRRGRGTGSGLGTTAGRGTKGQNSRAGGGVRPRFEGGHTPLYRLLPKLRGFTSRFTKTAIVNIEELDKHFAAGDTVNLKTLKSKRLVPTQARNFKILGEGEIKKKLSVYTPFISKAATKKIEAAGGKIIGAQVAAKPSPKK